MKILRVLILIICMLGCSNIGVDKDGNSYWTPTSQVVNVLDRIKVGDILIKNKLILSPTSWFGHAAVVVTPNIVGEYPMIGKGFVLNYLEDWLSEDRDIIVLRYRYFTDSFQRRFLKNVLKYSNREYQITFDKYNSEKFYCSQYVWFLYYKTAKEQKDPHFDYDFKKNDFFILPYDLLELPQFEIIDLK